MLDIQEYTTQIDQYQGNGNNGNGNGNGYSQLQGDWSMFYKVAKGFVKRVRPEDVQQTLDAGCNGFVRKPIDIDELPKQVAEHIARVSSAD